MDPAYQLWWKDPGFSKRMREKTFFLFFFISYLEHKTRRLGAEQDHLPFGSTGIESGNCQETKTCMVRACHTPQQPLQNHTSGHLGWWATPWSAQEMLDEQYQQVDITNHARAAHKGLLQGKKMEEDLFWIVPRVPLTTQSVKGLNWTESRGYSSIISTSDIG